MCELQVEKMQRIFFIYPAVSIACGLLALRCASPEFPRRLPPRSVLRSRFPSITAKTLLVHYSTETFLSWVHCLKTRRRRIRKWMRWASTL